MDKIKKINFFFIIAILPPFFLLIPLAQYSLEKPFFIFPCGNTGETAVWTYNDPEKSAIIDFRVKKDNIVFTFIHEKPGSFAGIGINLAEYGDFFDFSPYSHIFIDLTANNIEACTVIIKLFVPGITNMNDSASFRHLGYNVPIKENQTGYICPLSDFRDPFWWTRDYNPGRIGIGRDTLKNGCFLLVDSSQGESPPDDSSLQVNRESSMTIKTISLYRSHLFHYSLIGLSAVLYYFLLFIILRVNKRRRLLIIEKGPAAMIAYKRLALESHKDMDLRKIIGFFKTSYTDPDISLVKMGHDLGLSPTRISFLVKREFGLSFKQMLNKIRLTEAKRLLAETDRQIIDIAFAVGYNDRSYFYKVFLKNEGISPSDFRKEHA
ncbi:MAG: helix-turn-helix transcriptional regulator [Spirochaetales bacterium]|nr:helix-turn-helix transcriptional regulator [Spirochaetales bacterium]